VVASVELARALEGHEVVGLFHDAENAAVTARVGADAAGILLGDVEANAAVDDLGLELRQRLGEALDFVARALEQEEGQPLGGLGPDAGEPLQRFDEPGDRLGVISHYMPRPGILRPAVSLPISAWTISFDFRSASLHAARMRSSSICESSGLMTSR